MMIILWNRGTWKTLLASLLAWMNRDMPFILNFKLNAKNAIFCQSFEAMEQKMTEIEGRKVLVIDEAQKLMNSRRAMTELNMELLRFIVESRKYGADLIFISQTFFWVDKQIREQADWVLELEKDTWAGVCSMVKVKKKGRSEETGEIYFFPVNIVTVEDMVWFMKKIGVEYNTQEKVFLDSKKWKDE